MKGWYEWLADLPLRTKIAITVVGAVIAALGVSSYFSFRYWEEQALSAAREQAVLAATSSRSGVESALDFGRVEQARRSLERLTRQGSLLHARAYAPDGTIVLSSDPGEEGERRARVWMPDAREIPSSGLVKETSSGDAVRVFLPLRTPNAAVFEVVFSVRHVEQAMRRGSHLGLGLAVGSVLVLALVFSAMVRREVVVPMERIQELLSRATGARPSRREDELGGVEKSITELIEKEAAAEREAERRRRELEQRAGFAEVGELAAEMAHELKRPLANIRTAVDLLEQEYELSPAGRDLLDSVEGQLDHLGATMGDLFSLARPVELEREEVEAPTVLDDALSQVAGGPGWSEVELRTDYDPDTPPVVGDPRRIEQAVANLLSNAVEAMPGGGVLTVACGPSPDGGVFLSVSDTGVGIPPERLEEVVRPFYSTKPRGTGLGLALVGRIVAAHGGELEIDTDPGEGTTVRIVFPGPAGAEAAEDPFRRDLERVVS